MKKLVEVILIILLCVGCTPNKESVSTKEEIINNIISYDNNYDYDFLNYIYNNYGINTLENINTSYKNNTYSYNVWHVYHQLYISYNHHPIKLYHLY